MFIQRRRDAKRIYSTIVHSKTNSDGYKTEGITFPSREAQYKLMKECYKEAKIDPEEKINYVEAHITGKHRRKGLNKFNKQFFFVYQFH